METIDQNSLAANAYRTLGISGAASQSGIESAARMMRIWPDPSRIPPTQWDLPDMGAVARSKSEIEQAVSQLGQPMSRLRHRLLWFTGEHPFPNQAPGSETSLPERHTRAVTDLQTAWNAPEADNDGSRWLPIIDRLCDVFQSAQMLAWQEELEQRGKFDKPATTREISEAIDAVPNGVAGGLVRMAMTALDQGRIQTVNGIALAVGNVPPSPRCPSPIHDLMDRMEDHFNARCDEMEKGLRANLRTNSQSPYLHYSDNLDHAQIAAGIYERGILPTVSILMGLAKGLPDRLSRLRGRCGELLVLLALGWEWAGKYIVAEAQLQEALKISQGTLFEMQARKELDRVAPLAAHEREWGWAVRQAQPASVIRPGSVRFKTAKSGGGTSRRGIAAVGFLIIFVIRALVSSSSSSSNQNNSPAVDTPYTYPQMVRPNLPLPDVSLPDVSLKPLVTTDPFPGEPTYRLPPVGSPSKIPLGDNYREP